MADDPYRPIAAERNDPTRLTVDMVLRETQMILRELQSAKDLLNERLTTVHVRLDAMDKAQSLFEENLTRVPTEVDRAIAHLQELHSGIFRERFGTVQEKFNSIEGQFRIYDEHAKSAALSIRQAVEAALQAQREINTLQNSNIAQALARIETTAQRQIEQAVTLSQAATAATNEKVDDLKQRQTLMEGRTVGITAASTLQQGAVQTQQGSNSNILSIIAVGVALIGIIAGAIMAFVK